MLKSTAGGGGIGMRVCNDATELSEAFEAVKRLGQNNFSDSGVFIEKYIQRARHLEVQVFGDGKGEVLALGVRDCSVQRRNQKVLEETPAPNLPAGMAKELCAAAIQLAKAVKYRSAGTVEFVYDSQAARFYFLEVNTRLQVEHGVTEQVWDVDLVRWMIELAAGDLPPLAELARNLTPRGHAIQARLYAEDPGRDFQPSPGLLTAVAFPEADGKKLRIDTWVEAGCEIPPYFDPMIAKVISWAATREQASAALDQALADTLLYGVESNRNYLRQILLDAPFASGEPWTRCLEGLSYQASTFEVLSAGTQTTVQDFPGRLGYWAVGVPPSGPMDDRALRLGNRLLGNAQGAAALEITMSGPSLRFNSDAVVAVTGAPIPLSVDGIEQPLNTALPIKAGSTLSLGTIQGPGARSYLCLRGGLQVPDYLGSKSTFTLGQFGGHGGRALRAGDVLHLLPLAHTQVGACLPAELCDALPAIREIRVIYGPHGAPEYFTPAYIETFFATAWEVHFNSSRTGVRLIGPKPEWVRDSGGEAGLHPSNIHDNPYAIGAVDFTGDMPVILGPDGPSLGGFVCPVTIIEADLWQLGQLKAGDKVKFVPVDIATARQLAKAQNLECADLCRSELARDQQCRRIASKLAPTRANALTAPIVLDIGEADKRLVARLSADTHLLLEIGAPELDLVLRFRGHALMQALEAKRLDGVIDLTPGIRSLQLHYQPETLALADLLGIIAGEWDAVCAAQDLKVPSRIVHLPLSWDDPACQLAIEKYMTTVRKDAPWCPNNLEFIRRINDLPNLDEVYRTVFEASYLVMGLGDVYLGAPVATPLDPRHRLVTTKYNPARTWTAENSVGIGGAYMCVYGMEGPGGYQFVGRTLQMWNRYREVAAFDGKPWLLRFFDQIRFYPVSADELLRIRRDFPLGRYDLRIEHSELHLADYQAFLDREAEGIAAFRAQQRGAFDAERQRWIESGQAHFDSEDVAPGLGDVYLGAPVATPVDPRHRLVTTKYNPARTWTPENAVGIGGAYMCVYGMEGPGGYQFVGRTLQMWNRYREVAAFDGKPWLLRFFDQIRFYPVSAEELLRIRRDFPLGRYDLRIEHSELHLADYQAFLDREAEGIEAFRNQQRAAFDAERQRWIASGQAHYESEEVAADLGEDAPLGAGLHSIESHIAGNLWQVQVTAGSRVKAGDVLVILESMKMEIPLLAPIDGVVSEVRVEPGSPVRAGQRVVVLQEA